MRRTPRIVTVCLFLGGGTLAVGAARGGAGFLVRDARAEEAQRAGCPDGLAHRTAEETIRQHVALLQAGQLDEAMCDFDDDAQVILPGQVIQGLDNIRAGLAGVGSLLGGAVPQIRTLTATQAVVLLTFTALGTPCTIPDGADTYVVERGHIRVQTVHDTLHDAPNAVCPVGSL